MAKTPVSDEELQLKKKARRRLVGAVVLVLLVVVFVPMFLDREPRSQRQDIDIRIPPIPGQSQPPQAPAAPPAADAAPPASTTAPADKSNPAAIPPAVDASANAPKPDSNPAPASDRPAAQAPAAVEPAEPAPKAAEAATKPQSTANESYVIQIGAFSDTANARHLVEKMKAEKVPAYTEAIKTAQGEKTRVRAGPYPTLAAAERGRARLKTLKLLSGGEAKIVHKGE